MNAGTLAVAESLGGCGCVSARGLLDRGDQLHFGTAAQHELGRRYAAELARLLPECADEAERESMDEES